MTLPKIIDVSYEVYSSPYMIKKELNRLLRSNQIMSFDVECRSVYDKDTREEADTYLKNVSTNDDYYKQARLVSESSGLSFPSIVRTTHFIFGTSRSESVIFICETDEMEMYLWEKIAEYKGLILIHNSLFDLKIMYQRIRKLPQNFIDTALFVKSMINHVDIWKAKTGLKVLMANYYDPKWSLMEDYEPEDYKDKEFLNYCGIDGAACYYLYELILEELA